MLVGRFRVEGVGPGQIDDFVGSARCLAGALLALYGYPWVISDVLAKSGQGVKKRRFPRIWIPDQRNYRLFGAHVLLLYDDSLGFLAAKAHEVTPDFNFDRKTGRSSPNDVQLLARGDTHLQKPDTERTIDLKNMKR